MKNIPTSGELIGFDKFFEEVVSRCDFVQVVCVGGEPEFEGARFLQNSLYLVYDDL